MYVILGTPNNEKAGKGNEKVGKFTQINFKHEKKHQ